MWVKISFSIQQFDFDKLKDCIECLDEEGGAYCQGPLFLGRGRYSPTQFFLMCS